MFPGYQNASGKIVGKLRTAPDAKVDVAAGWPSLLEAMAAAQINTPERMAAFLTTLCFESWCEYNAVDGTYGTRTYAGRGFIQLTGKVLGDGQVMNYGPAGRYFGIDLIGQPDLALSLEWSARIATWYWTVARNCNEYADRRAMGKVNGAIGYPLSGSNDTDRCMVFGEVLRRLIGSVPAGITCTR